MWLIGTDEQKSKWSELYLQLYCQSFCDGGQRVFRLCMLLLSLYVKEAWD